MADSFSALSRRVNAATADRQREAAVRAARLAVDRFPPQDPVVAEAAARLGTDAATSPAALDGACEALEERSMDSGDEEAAFVAARVAFAVRAALDPDPRQASAALVELLLERVPLEGKAVDRALKAVRAGNTGPSLARRALNRYSRGLDDERESMTAFALYSALRSDPVAGAQAVAFAVSEQLGDDPAVARRLAERGLLDDR